MVAITWASRKSPRFVFGCSHAKLQPLAMDPRRSPERVGKADVTDQFADVRRQLRTAARRSRPPSPVKAKTRAVPADYSFWLNNRQGAQHVRRQTIQSGEYQPIADGAAPRSLLAARPAVGKT